MDGWYDRELVTRIFTAGSTLRELGFPEEWTFDPLRAIFEKDGYNSHEGVIDGPVTQWKWCLSLRSIREAMPR